MSLNQEHLANMTCSTPGCEADEMKLPEGKTCRDCVHNARCVVFGFTKPGNTRCDFHPSRFAEREPGWAPCGHPAGSDTCPRCGP